MTAKCIQTKNQFAAPDHCSSSTVDVVTLGLIIMSQRTLILSWERAASSPDSQRCSLTIKSRHPRPQATASPSLPPLPTPTRQTLPCIIIIQLRLSHQFLAP